MDRKQDEILIMPAGPEMDTLMADKVMGWQSLKGYDGGFWHPQKKRTQMILDSEIHKARRQMGIETDRIGSGFVWSPSQDPSAALEVIEKMTRKYHWKITSPFDKGRPWFAGFTPLGVTGWNGRPDFEASGETFMLAICRAALLTTYGKEEKEDERGLREIHGKVQSREEPGQEYGTLDPEYYPQIPVILSGERPGGHKPDHPRRHY